MNSSDIKDTIKKFLMKSFKDYDFQEDENIFALGFVNSLFAMQLVTFIEGEFALEVDNEDLEMSNFQSISALAALVARKKAA